MELVVYTGFALFFVTLIVLGARNYLHEKRIDELELFEDAEASPASITLEPVEQYGWLVEPEVQHTLRELESLGFVQQGTYRVVEMDGLHVIGLFHPSKNYIASLYADTRGITWVDLSAVTADGEVLTASNSLNEELIASTGQYSMKVDKSWSIVELFAQQEELCRGLELAPVKGVSFATMFVQSYSKDMRVHNEDGGVLNKEAYRIQQESLGEMLNEEELEERYASYVFRCGVLRLSDECCREFLQSNSLNIDAHNLLAIHSGIPIEYLLPFVARKMLLSDATLTKLESAVPTGSDAQQAFIELNTMLPEKQRAKPLGEVSVPTKAVIYQIPQYEQ